MVSEGVWCLKVYDIISGPDRWQGCGVSPAAGGEKIWAFFSPSKHIICVCIHRDRETEGRREREREGERETVCIVMCMCIYCMFVCMHVNIT
jgi:hypothetical protein